jgi:hypothetical protein
MVGVPVLAMLGQRRIRMRHELRRQVGRLVGRDHPGTTRAHARGQVLYGRALDETADRGYADGEALGDLPG